MGKILEKHVLAACKKYLGSLPNCKFRKRLGGASNPGEPDLTVCIRGIRFEIELKAPGKEEPRQQDKFRKLGATALQSSELHGWEDAGAVAAVVCDVEQLKKIVEAALQTTQPSRIF